MTYKTHIAGGILLTLCVTTLIQPTTLSEIITLYGGTVIGSLLPDIDHPESKINKYNPFDFIIGSVVNHRGVTHSIIGLATTLLIGAIMALICGLKLWFMFGIGIGYLSHLILDMMTPSGVPLFYPRKNRYNICKISTGSNGEKALLAMIWFVFVWIILK